jgi:RNA polymerase sigma factor (TIGR02999 family)
VPEQDSGEVTVLVQRFSAGEPGARERLWEAILPVLTRIARSQKRRERSGHTLETANIVSELFLRLDAGARQGWESSQHFYATASKVIRNILIDYARRRGARAEGAPQVELEDGLGVTAASLDAAIDVDRAIEDLQGERPRVASVVEGRVFGGKTVEELAEELNISERQVKRDWALGKAWLRRRLELERFDEG